MGQLGAGIVEAFGELLRQHLPLRDKLGPDKEAETDE
jgi:hypothetical protein